MKKITDFTVKADMRKIGKEVEEAINKIAEKHGLTCIRGNIRYTPAELKFTGVKFFTEAAPSKNESAAEDFKMFAPMYGLDGNLLGTKVTLSGKTFTITGFNNRASKNKVIIENAKGVSYSTTVENVKLVLNYEDCIG